jgi:hypothetical protein
MVIAVRTVMYRALELFLIMASNSTSRTRRTGWRFFLGLSVLGLLIIASASHAADRLIAAAPAPELRR